MGLWRTSILGLYDTPLIYFHYIKTRAHFAFNIPFLIKTPGLPSFIWTFEHLINAHLLVSYDPIFLPTSIDHSNRPWLRGWALRVIQNAFFKPIVQDHFRHIINLLHRLQRYNTEGRRTSQVVLAFLENEDLKDPGVRWFQKSRQARQKEQGKAAAPWSSCDLPLSTLSANSRECIQVLPSYIRWDVILLSACLLWTLSFVSMRRRSPCTFDPWPLRPQWWNDTDTTFSTLIACYVDNSTRASCVTHDAQWSSVFLMSRSKILVQVLLVPQGIVHVQMEIMLLSGL